MTRRGWFGSLVAGVAAWWWPKPAVAPEPELVDLWEIYIPNSSRHLVCTSLSNDDRVAIQYIFDEIKKRMEARAAAGDYQI